MFTYHIEEIHTKNIKQSGFSLDEFGEIWRTGCFSGAIRLAHAQFGSMGGKAVPPPRKTSLNDVTSSTNRVSTIPFLFIPKRFWLLVRFLFIHRRDYFERNCMKWKWHFKILKKYLFFSSFVKAFI